MITWFGAFLGVGVVLGCLLLRGEICCRLGSVAIGPHFHGTRARNTPGQRNDKGSRTIEMQARDSKVLTCRMCTRPTKGLFLRCSVYSLSKDSLKFSFGKPRVPEMGEMPYVPNVHSAGMLFL